MKKTTMLVVLVALAAGAFALAGCGGDGGGGGDDGAEEVSIELSEQNGSGQSGTATLMPTGDGQTTVVVEVSNPPDVPQPAHIHPGTCADLDPQPAHGLTNVEDGTSETTVDVPLDELRDGDFAINVHKSGDEIDVYVACGDIS